MKTIQKLGVASALLGFSIPLLAEVEANVGVTSNYLWRGVTQSDSCLLYTSPSPRDQRGSRMPSSA